MASKDGAIEERTSLISVLESCLCLNALEAKWGNVIFGTNCESQFQIVFVLSSQKFVYTSLPIFWMRSTYHHSSLIGIFLRSYCQFLPRIFHQKEFGNGGTKLFFVSQITFNFILNLYWMILHMNCHDYFNDKKETSSETCLNQNPVCTELWI